MTKISRMTSTWCYFQEEVYLYSKGAHRIRVQRFCDFLLAKLLDLQCFFWKYYGHKCEFCCQYHLDWKVTSASKIAVNIHFNNKQKKRKIVFVKTHWRALKPVNGVNNLFYDTLFGFTFLIIKIDCGVRVIGVVFSEVLLIKVVVLVFFLVSHEISSTFQDKRF